MIKILRRKTYRRTKENLNDAFRFAPAHRVNKPTSCFDEITSIITKRPKGERFMQTEANYRIAVSEFLL